MSSNDVQPPNDDDQHSDRPDFGPAPGGPAEETISYQTGDDRSLEFPPPTGQPSNVDPALDYPPPGGQPPPDYPAAQQPSGYPPAAGQAPASYRPEASSPPSYPAPGQPSGDFAPPGAHPPAPAPGVPYTPPQHAGPPQFTPNPPAAPPQFTPNPPAAPPQHTPDPRYGSSPAAGVGGYAPAGPPQHPTGDQPGAATEIVSGYAPPSQANAYGTPQPAYLGGGHTTGPVGPAGGGGRPRAIILGVLGGLVVLGLLAAGALVLANRDDGDDTATGDTATSSTTEASTTTTEATTTTTESRVGTSVSGLELATGDCINYDTTGDNIETFDVVTCGTPHLAEIAAQVEHPDAGGAYPGVEGLLGFGSRECLPAVEEFLGVSAAETSLVSNPLVATNEEWSDGLTSVSCLVGSADGDLLIESVEGRGSSYARDTESAVEALRTGDCFDPQPGVDAFSLVLSDTVQIVSCTEDHAGQYFGQGEVNAGDGASYPGLETLDTDAVAACDRAFRAYYGLDPAGVNYRFWSPTETDWNNGERTIHCALIDPDGIAGDLDLAALQPMVSLPIGSCFLYGPAETSESLGIDDRVETIDCADGHEGQLFGFGELSSDGGAFPGSDVVDSQVLDLCVARFEDYVGLSPFDSEFGDFIYWFPNQTGWADGDLRWACALLTDEPQAGSIEGANR